MAVWRSSHRQDERLLKQRQMTASGTQPARLVPRTSLLGGRTSSARVCAGREERLPKAPSCLKNGDGRAWTRRQGEMAGAGREHPCIPFAGQRGRAIAGLPGGGEEGRKEEGTGRGSRGDGPVRAAWLLSIEGAYHCHCLGLITGTCLQPRRLPAGVITSNRAGLGSPVQPHGFIAARNPALSALPQHHPTGLPAASPGTRCPVHPATGRGPHRHHQLC